MWRTDPYADAAVYAASGGQAAALEWAATRRPAAVLSFECFDQCVTAAAQYGHGELLERLLRRQESDVDIYAGARSAFFQAQFATHRVLELAALHCPAPTLRRLFVDWVPSGLVKWPTRCSLGWLVARAIVSPRADWEEKADFLAAQLQGAVPAEGFELTAEDEVTSQWIGTAIWNDKAGWGAVTQPELGKRHARLVGLAAYGVRPSNWHEELAQVLAISGNASALRELLDVWVQPVGSTWKSTVPGHAACSGHVPTMELLRERLGSHAFKLDDALAAARLFYGTAGLRYLAELKGLSAADTPRRGTAVTWNAVFSEAARCGADVELLRLLHERRGAAVDLKAVEEGGSVEAAEWAAGALLQAAVAGQAVAPTPEQVEAVAIAGHLATAVSITE